MVKFSKVVRQVPGLNFLADALDIQSTPGRHHLHKMPFMTDVQEIECHLSNIQRLKDLHASAGSNETIRSLLVSLKHALYDVHDIQGTLHALLTGITLDDIGLFEIKKLALVSEKIKELLSSLQCTVVHLADLSEVVNTLDPEKQRVAHFFIYDTYSDELRDLRKQFIRKLQTDESQAESIRLQAMELEDSIREKLTDKLRPFCVDMTANLAAIAELDVWNAKAELAIKYHLSRPAIASDSEGDEITSYLQLFNPEIAEVLKQSGKAYQAVDISFANEPCLITGANMGGKTVLLRTLALAQYLFQFGFFVPAKEASIVPVTAVMTSMDDSQDALKGLSSFASEMLKINAILQETKKNSKGGILALIDEPARTTNPAEGQAIVNALLDILTEHSVRCMVTTHYSGIRSHCRRLRVAGLRTEQITSKPTTATINDYMDYSLIEIHPGKSFLSLMPQRKGEASGMDEVPREAIRVAALLEIDEDLLQRATKYLHTNKSE